MKEAFGGTFTLKLLMVFFVVYVTFLGVALNIAKAYRIKNGVINILEQQQFDINDASRTNDVNDIIYAYLYKIPYKVSSETISDDCKAAAKEAGDSAKYQSDNGVCIIQYPGNYYKVTVYMYAEFPFLHISVKLPISGETMSMVK
ncbi:MAG: hypothetical protein VZS44_06120 [Bacilli bacterium]|nr:hypothetical protein [Bacilli bacterium]